MKFFIITIFLIFLIFTSAQAETILLKSGKTIEGKVISQNDEEVKVDTGAGVFITYYLDEIKSIDGKSIKDLSQNVFSPKYENDKIIATCETGDCSKLGQSYEIYKQIDEIFEYMGRDQKGDKKFSEIMIENEKEDKRLTLLFEDSDETVRLDAVQKICELGFSFEPLRKAAQDSSWKVRKLAIGCLGEKGDVGSLPLIEQALHDENAQVRTEAHKAKEELIKLRQQFAEVTDQLEQSKEKSKKAMEWAIEERKKLLKEYEENLNLLEDPEEKLAYELLKEQNGPGGLGEMSKLIENLSDEYSESDMLSLLKISTNMMKRTQEMSALHEKMLNEKSLKDSFFRSDKYQYSIQLHPKEMPWQNPYGNEIYQNLSGDEVYVSKIVFFHLPPSKGGISCTINIWDNPENKPLETLFKQNANIFSIPQDLIIDKKQYDQQKILLEHAEAIVKFWEIRYSNYERMDLHNFALVPHGTNVYVIDYKVNTRSSQVDESFKKEFNDNFIKTIQSFNIL